MVSMEQTGSKIHHSSIYRFHSPSSTHLWREIGRSKRTIRSNLYSGDQSSAASFAITPDSPKAPSLENLSDSSVDLRLTELAATSRTARPSLADDDFLPLTLSHSSFNSDYTACGSDISGELQRLATVATSPATSEAAEEGKDKSSSTPCSSTITSPQNPNPNNPHQSPKSGGHRDHDKNCGLPAAVLLLSDSLSPEEVAESMSPDDLQPTVHTCVEVLLRSPSSSASSKRSAAAMLRLLAKNHSDNRVLIANSGAVPALVPLLRCSDPAAQEHAVTALLNLSLHQANKAAVVGAAGAVKSLIYVLKTGTDVAKQNAAAALMSLAMVEENRLTIGACGAIPPLVALLVGGTARGKKDALTTLYKLCTARQNKERAVRAGAVGPLVKMVGEEVVAVEEGGGMVAEKAMVVLSSLTGIKEGKEAIVEEGGIGALVEAVEDSSDKGKEFAVLTLMQLCVDSVKNRGLLIREGGIPPLVGLSQTGTAKAKHKAETLLGYLRESRQEAVAATSTP